MGSAIISLPTLSAAAVHEIGAAGQRASALELELELLAPQILTSAAQAALLC